MALRRLDRRARLVLVLFAHTERITAAQVAQTLSLSDRMARHRLQAWAAEGWLEVADPSRRGRAYALSAIYRQHIGALSTTNADPTINHNFALIWAHQMRLRQVIAGEGALTEVESALRDLALAGKPLSIRPLGCERSTRKTFAPVLTRLEDDIGQPGAAWQLDLPDHGRVETFSLSKRRFFAVFRHDRAQRGEGGADTAERCQQQRQQEIFWAWLCCLRWRCKRFTLAGSYALRSDMF